MEERNEMEEIIDNVILSEEMIKELSNGGEEDENVSPKWNLETD